jgi:hypothetical protein
MITAERLFTYGRKKLKCSFFLLMYLPQHQEDIPAKDLSAAGWCHNYRHRSRGVHWWYKQGTDSDRVHEPTEQYDRKTGSVAWLKNKVSFGGVVQELCTRINRYR